MRRLGTAGPRECKARPDDVQRPVGLVTEVAITVIVDIAVALTRVLEKRSVVVELGNVVLVEVAAAARAAGAPLPRIPQQVAPPPASHCVPFGFGAKPQPN